MKRLFLALFVLFLYSNTYSQCSPDGSDECSIAGVLCGAEMLDNFSCTSISYSNPTGPLPNLCLGTGASQNTQWWAFRGNGKTISFTFNTDMASCANNKGIQAGIIFGCGGTAIDCNADCSTNPFTISVNTANHNGSIYHLWVDGCQGDVCDFDITVTNGEAAQIPSNFELINYEKDMDCKVVICNNLEGELWDYDITWYVNDVPFSHNEYCVDATEYKVLYDEPFEICAIVDLPGASGAGACGHEVRCVTIDPITPIDQGYKTICWEQHEGFGYYWREADTVIYSSCIDPPCVGYGPWQSDCLSKYILRVELLPQRDIGESYVFICDPTMLPYRSEEGQLFYESACNKLVTFPDEVYGCDTSYLLTLEVFDPEIAFSTSCPGCGDSISIEADIQYNPECALGETTWETFWVNTHKDTFFSDRIDVAGVEDSFRMYLIVHYTDNNSGGTEQCVVHKKNWYVKVNPAALEVMGEDIVCDMDTGFYRLPEFFDRGCDVQWTIEGLDGKIIHPFHKSPNVIKVVWQDNRQKKGRICARFTDNCGEDRVVCKDLSWCIATSVVNSQEAPWSVYPNPVNDWFVVQFSDAGSAGNVQFQLRDIHGREVPLRMESYGEKSWKIDMKPVSSGVYLLHVQDGQQAWTEKLVVK